MKNEKNTTTATEETTTKKKVLATGTVTITMSGLEAKSAKIIVDSTGAESASKNGNAYDAVFPITTDTIRAARTDGISNYGALFGFKSNVSGATIGIDNCEPGMLDTLSRLIRRSSHHLTNLGVDMAVVEGGIMVECKAIPASPNGAWSYDDAVLQTTCAILLIARAYKALNHTEHPLTYFDFLQAIGVTDGVRREEESAVTILNGLDHYIKPEKKAKASKKKEGGAASSPKTSVKPATKPAPATNAPTAGKKKPAAPPVGNTGNIMPGAGSAAPNAPKQMSVKEKIAAAKAKKEAAAAAAAKTTTNGGEDTPTE